MRRIMEISSILYIDDDADDQEFFEIALQAVNKEILLNFAKNGLEGYNKLIDMNIKPGIIFLDLNMPLMDGKQFLEKIKKEPDYRDIPIAIYSTSSAITDKEQTIGMGANYFVTKPNKIDDIVKILHNILS